MKKNFKRTLAKVMAVALTVSMLGVSANDADAAKKIKLSSKSISVVKGKTKKVTIKNVKAKKVKKLTVKSANKKIATVKKSGKTAIKVTGKKAGKSTKVTVKVKVGKKTTKLTLKVKVTKAKAPAKTAAPTAAPASATPAASAAATPAASAAATPAASAAATPVASDAPSATPVATAPVQPDEPTTPAKELPEVNLRRDNVPAWVMNGEYGTALFNTNDTISYSSQGWSKAGDCYNNGMAWYIDSAKKGKIDMSEYSEVALTIKTDAEVKFMTWGGSADPEDFWSKTDTWGNVKETIQNADGSKTLVYDLETVFGSATKVKKATTVGFTLKSDLNGDDKAFSERTATVYSIKFIKGSSQGGNETGSNETSVVETPDGETSNVETPVVETPDGETGNVETPEVTPSAAPSAAPTKAPTAAPSAVPGFNGTFDLTSKDIKMTMNTHGQDESKCITKVVDGKIQVYACTMNYLDISAYLANNNIDLDEYSKLKITVDAIDKDGKVIDVYTMEGEEKKANYEKIALVTAAKLDGYTDCNINQSTYNQYHALGSTVEYDLTIASDDVESYNEIGGWNIQLNNLYGDKYQAFAPAGIQITSIVLEK